MNKRKVGALYEAMAGVFLEEQGYVILERNYRCPLGEIDLICRGEGYLIFVEVKYRSGGGQGGAFMAVTTRKQHKISQVASWYLMKRKLGEDTPCRFDVIGIDGDRISHLENAFYYS